MPTEPGAPPPEILWKYRQWDDHAKAMIESSELYYATIGQLNDPLDCHWCEKYPTDPKELFSYAKAFCTMYIPTETDNERVIAVAALIEMLRELTANADDGRIWTLAKLRLGVLSMSEVCNDFLMWSHYAAGHKGICVGIRTERLVYEGSRLVLRPCEYRKEPLTISAWEYARDQVEPYLDAMCCKASRWSYEKEWRSIVSAGPYKFPGCVDRIVLGVSVDDKTKSEILDAVAHAGHPITILQAKRHPFEYKLLVEPLED